MHEPREALRQAVITLVEAPDADQLHESLTAAIRLARVHPIELTGDASTLNPLLHLAVRDPAAFQRIMALVDSKRVQAGRLMLVPPREEKFDKVEYMRAFMDQKRQR